jgi:uncharacterized NAD(P)/FAD-binding protein YdhS
MSAFREDVDDFVTWANHEADRTGWPPEWREFTFTESGPAPRRIYPDYLTERLTQAAREALDGVTLVEVDGEAIDLDVRGAYADVVIRTGTGTRTLRADHVVLATGLERKYPSFADPVLDHPAFVRHPYSAAGAERILGLRPDAVVAIVGTLLSAYDSAALLLRHGHTGKIHMISGSGLTLRTYPVDHRHRVIDLPPPRLNGDTYDGPEDFARRVRDEWELACRTVTREHPEIPASVVSEHVSKAWEPYVPEILAGIPSADLRALLDRYGSLLATKRVGVMAYTTELVEAAMAGDGQVVVTAGKVAGIHGTEAGTLVVSVTGAAPRTIDADLVISNFGRESNYERVDSALWANLLRKGIACAHRRTGRGVEVDGCGNLVGASGLPSGPVSVVGSPREGDEIVKHGRTGAFTFNLAAIKNHSVEVATSALCRLESCYDTAAATLADAPELTEAVSYSTMIEVRRMTARRRDHRQALTSHLEDSLRTIQAITTRHGTAATDRAVRLAITEVASAKLKDISVTPRDLRSLLGLENRMEPID